MKAKRDHLGGAPRACLALAAAGPCILLDSAAHARQPACQPRVRMKTLLDNLQVGRGGVLM